MKLNLPNKLTILRILLIPVFMLIIILEIPNEAVMVKLEITSSRAEPKLLPLAVYGKN